MENTGSVDVFERSSPSGWTQVAHLEASDLAEVQRFGTAVGISGGTLLAGADQDDQSGSIAGAAYVLQVVASPRIEITGSCPEEVTLELSGATPWGSVVVAHADSEGGTIVPAGECGAVELDLEDADLLARFPVAEDGSKALARTVPAGACGRLLQAVDGVTCGVGPVAAVP